MKKLIIPLFILLITCVACDSSSDTEDNNTPPIVSSYLVPANNQICTGIEATDTTMEVYFEWNDFIDIEDTSLLYRLKIVNLSNNNTVTEVNLTTNNYTSLLDKGVSFSWTVVATDSGGKSVTGLTWMFQTPLEALTNYVPFPAIMISPNNGERLFNNMVTLEWEGNDPDEGETEQLLYDIYLSDSNPPSLTSSNQSELFYNENLSPNVYYWYIVSKDPNNQSSNSQIRQFIVD